MRLVKSVKVIVGVLGVLTVLAVLLGLLLVAATIWLLDDDLLGDDIEVAEFDTVAEWPAAASFADQLELDLPDSTRNIFIASSGFQEPIYHLRFTVDPLDVETVAASVGCGGLVSQQASSPPGALVDGLEWWQASEATRFQSCEESGAPGRVQHGFIDRSPNDAAVVYVVVIYL